MNANKETDVKWPSPWAPIGDEFEALANGRRWGNGVASTIIDELHREICEIHPLYGVGCIPIAYDARSGKEFVFLTDKLDAPVVLVHFTWNQERDPKWPFIVVYQNIEEFVRKERNRRKKWWQFWI
jgi:hypothetical protein